MRIHTEDFPEGPCATPTVGMVYPCAGGRGAKYGRLMILLAVREPDYPYEGRTALMLIVRKDGTPYGVTQYGIHYLEDRVPIGFVEGLDSIDLSMRPL